MKATPPAIDAAANGRGCNQTARKTETSRIRQGKNPLGGNASPFTKYDPDASLIFEPSVTESGNSAPNLGGTGSSFLHPEWLSQEMGWQTSLRDSSCDC
jgi:hypothetical protein